MIDTFVPTASVAFEGTPADHTSLALVATIAGPFVLAIALVLCIVIYRKVQYALMRATAATSSQTSEVRACYHG
jgi:hypothetical protein